MKTQQLEIKLSNKTEEDIKKARRKSTQAGKRGATLHPPPTILPWVQKGEGWGMAGPGPRLAGGAVHRQRARLFAARGGGPGSSLCPQRALLLPKPWISDQDLDKRVHPLRTQGSYPCVEPT